MTRSNYKYHNTLKFLILVTPNSSIVFVFDVCLGRMYGWRILTNFCGYLETLQEEYSEIMVEGFRWLFKSLHSFNKSLKANIQRLNFK